MKPELFWKLSTLCYRRGWVIPAKLLKTFNYFIFRAVLPYEIELGENVSLWHRGLGVVIHPNIAIGDNVSIAHGVTIAGTVKGMSHIGNNVTIGSGVQIIPRREQPFTVGENAIIGAGSTVIGDVPASSITRGERAVPRTSNPSPTSSNVS
ncbi:hypothetical protein NNX28_14270 [Arthrobacter sp. zg-Y859]|uniref:Serine acetyltransferase n=1 Tax=Arthrobacter jinronghuae TaxID=2964609 RepID=A0ABT1NTM7_9MICC|nr:hypothetical protein [Arthrobacter jinronghuae]